MRPLTEIDFAHVNGATLGAVFCVVLPIAFAIYGLYRGQQQLLIAGLFCSGPPVTLLIARVIVAVRYGR